MRLESDDVEVLPCYSERCIKFLGDRDAIWFLWYTFTKAGGKRHVEVFNIAGDKQRPEEGINGMPDYNV